MRDPVSQLQLRDVGAEFAAARERFERLDAATADAKWHLRPTPEEWSVAECVMHLNLTSRAMLPRIRAAFDEARSMPPVGERRYRSTFLGWLLAATVGPVPRLAGLKLGKVATPPAFVPGSELPRAEVAGEFRRWLADEAALLESARGVAIDRATLESPFRAGTCYDGWSALLILVRHEHRHLAQAEQALARLP